MFKKDRSKDVRRSVGSHEKMMGALGRAALSNISETDFKPESLNTWVVPQTVRATDSPEAKIDKHLSKGLITPTERATERIYQASGPDYRFHKGIN
jgi:hypothetical protein